MYLMDYDSIKMTNYVQRFCIIPRIHNGKNLVTLAYIAHGLQFPIAHNVSLCYT